MAPLADVAIQIPRVSGRHIRGRKDEIPTQSSQSITVEIFAMLGSLDCCVTEELLMSQYVQQ